MIGEVSYRVAHPSFVVIAARRSSRARAPPRVVRPKSRSAPKHAKGLTVASASPGEPDPKHPEDITDRSQGMTHLTSACAQRNRPTRIHRIATYGDRDADEVQLDNSAEDDP
jgi:hypothetical protein